MAEYKLNGAYNVEILSKGLNERFAELYGRSVITEGFLVEARDESKVAVNKGKAVVDGVLISESPLTPQEILLPIPANTNVPSGKKYYVYLEYTHGNIATNYKSIADVKISVNDPGEAKNVAKIAIVTKRRNSNDILPSDIEMITYTNVSLATITSVVGNLNGDLSFNPTSKGIDLISKDGNTYHYPNETDIAARDTLVLNSSKGYTDLQLDDFAKIDKLTMVGGGVFSGNIDPLVVSRIEFELLKFNDADMQVRQALLDMKIELEERGLVDFINNNSGVGYYEVFNNSTGINLPFTTATINTVLKQAQFTNGQILTLKTQTFEEATKIKLSLVDENVSSIQVIADSTSNDVSVMMVPGSKSVGDIVFYDGQEYVITAITAQT